MKRPILFKYYFGRYPAMKGPKGEIITIPMDGGRNLNKHYIKPLINDGYELKECTALKEIYLIKHYQKGETK